ncbi:MAG: carboxypeptidase regulatory-like domain-containing protein [Bryobacteraceae bacterium]
MHSRTFVTFVRICLAAVVAAMLITSAGAQTGTSSVRGTVVDQQGSLIPGAKVTLTNEADKSVHSQNTGPAGSFSFDLIPPGDYRIEVESAGFKKLAEPVHALIAHPSDLTLTLDLGTTSETVTVRAENGAVQVNTQDSALGANILSDQIVNLPLEGRDVLSLLTLQAGVTRDGYVAGARSDQSNITLDGLDINEAQTSKIDAPVLRLNSEAIEEFRVATVNANANSGRSSGAQISLVTKRGSDQFHGSLFEYNRIRLFEANDWFNNAAQPAIPRLDLIRNTFGAALGGPIIKDRLFFFYSYEGRRDASGASAPVTIVPTPSLGQGLVSFKNTNGSFATLGPSDLARIFPETGGENPAAVQALAAAASKYSGNDFTAGDSQAGQLANTIGYRFNSPNRTSLNSHVLRLDANLTSNQTLFVRQNIIDDHLSNGTSAFPDTQQPTIWSHPMGYALGHTWTIGPSLVNSFHYGQTREAFSTIGDQHGNVIRFRNVFSPITGSVDVNRITPVHSLVDDLSWIKGKHTFQFGATFTDIRNNRTTFSGAYDSAITNPSFYNQGPTAYQVVNQYLKDTRGYGLDSSYNTSVNNAVTALLGRLNSYAKNYQFGHTGELLSAGTPSARTFATQTYEGYAQDIWKLKSNLTLTAGVHYTLARPIYETHGFELQPTEPLGTFFDKRVAGFAAGTPYIAPIVLNLSGPANNGKPLYNWDKTNFLPRVAVAWSPHSENRWISKVLGNKGESVLRGGFAMLNDYYGQQLATNFDLNNSLGFSASQTISAGVYNLGCSPYSLEVIHATNPAGSCPTTNLAPLFTGPNQPIRSLPRLPAPSNLTFPEQQPLDNQRRIQTSLDSNLVTPKNYVMSLTFERELHHGLLFQASYLGRLGRNLLAQRDVATPGNLVDPKSGMDWYTAATILEKLRAAQTPLSQIRPIPYFENLFPAFATNKSSPGCCFSSATQAVYNDLQAGNDPTGAQSDMDAFSTVGPNAFYQPQYGALTTWATIGNSNYHALAVSLRARTSSLTLDINYTYSHSLDDASGLQTNGNFGTSSLILNPYRQRDNYVSSDFDLRHQININSLYQLPFGRGRLVAGNASGVLEALIGGWQLMNIFRWNTGGPFGTPYDVDHWATNWETQSYSTLTRPLSPDGCQSKSPVPAFFGNCLTYAYQSFRNAYPGETGMRNYFRFPNFINLDLGLGKTWKMPYKEGHQLQLRGEVFNLTNTQPFQNPNFGIYNVVEDPNLNTPPPNWTKFNTVQNVGRVMQFGLRYSF